MNRSQIAVLVSASLLMLAPGAGATVTSFSTITTVGGQAVNAQATFTTGAGTVHIEIKNNIVDPTSVIQNLSALGFVLSSGQSSGTLTSSSANLRSVASNLYTDSGSAPTGWMLAGAYNMGSLGLRLCDLCSGASGPAHTLIGLPGANNKYNNANGSINGNGPHNPFLSGKAIFDLSVPGVTASSSIAKVRFQFGTTDGSNYVDITTALPVEGRSWGVMKQLYR